MQRTVMMSSIAQKDIQTLNKKQKKSLTEALDMMETLGQLGEPIHPKINGWIYRRDDVRIVYKLTPKEIVVLKIKKDG